MARSRPPVEGPAGNRARLANGLVLLGILVAQFLQRPGSITFDTKFDLTADPSAFLVRSLHLWNPELSFGELQNQAYGYFFPQGPFFLLGDLAGMPDWIVQRLWSALILIAAYEGARRLFRALASPVNPWLPMLAGLAFAFSPRLLGLVGVLSAEVLPTAVLPWVVLPLVHTLRGKYSARLGALLSGCAVLLMGGVNAIENLAALPLPALLIVCGLGVANGRRLALWWIAAVSAACAWWMLPLLVLGRYSPPFLDYIETSAATTRPLGWMNATRGADHWLAFIHVGGSPWWPGAFELATNPWLIAVTGIVAAVSLGGLFLRSMPARTPLCLSALLGLMLLTIAHASSWGSPLAEPIRALLDGPLPMLRNVHKVDPLVRLPLALGFAHIVGLALRILASSTVRARATRTPAIVLSAALACAAALLIAAAQPMFAGVLRKEGWHQVPRAWQQTVDYLEKNSDGGRALVLPGSGFGQQRWGWTIDEPIQGLARSPWVARSQVPLVPGQTLRFLDSIDERISDGRGSPALADALARAGISHVVVRRDLDLFASGAPAPNRVDQALTRSGGFTREASFGLSGFGTQPMIDVFAVQRDVPRVEAVDVTGVKTFVGGPEDVITLLETRELAPGETTVVSAEPGWSGRDPGAVADGYRLRERQFGRLQDSLSQVMSGTEDYRVQRRAHDYPGVSGVTRVRASYPDIETLRASSSSGYADTLGPVRPELGPYSGVDGVLATYWRSAPLENPRGQWLELKLKHPQPLTHVDVTVGVDGFSGVPVRRIRVDAGTQMQDVAVDPATGNVRVPLSGVNVDRLRVTVQATQGDPPSGVVAIREIALPGVELGRHFVVESGGASGESDFVFRSKPHRRACVDVGLGASCDPDVARVSEEEAGLYRTFETDSSGEWSVWGRVVARATPAAAELLSPVTSRVRVQASSVLADDPAVSGQWANDGSTTTSWLSAPGDLNPSLSLRWSEPRVLTRLRVQSAQSAARTPGIALLEANGQSRRVQIGPESFGVFNALRTDHVKITFPVQPQPKTEQALPVGISELNIDGLDDLKYVPTPLLRTGAACGFGPELRIDGRSVQTRVRGRLSNVIAGSPLRLEICGPVVRLSAGTHQLAVPSSERFAPSSLTLDSTKKREIPPPGRRVSVRNWDATHRSVVVGPGNEALLRVPENVNAGWQATLSGRVLKSTRIDGWQQGYRIPAGEGGLVRLDYLPDAPYRAALAGGGFAALLLVAVTCLVYRRERVTGIQALPLPVGTSKLWTPGRIGWVALLGLAYVTGGVAVVLGAFGGLLLRRRPEARWLTAIILIAGASLVASVLPHLLDQPPLELADLVAGAGVGLLLATMTSPASLGRKGV